MCSTHYDRDEVDEGETSMNARHRAVYHRYMQGMHRRRSTGESLQQASAVKHGPMYPDGSTHFVVSPRPASSHGVTVYLDQPVPLQHLTHINSHISRSVSVNYPFYGTQHHFSPPVGFYFAGASIDKQDRQAVCT